MPIFIMRDFISQRKVYKNLAFEVISRALDDICPIEIPNPDVEDGLTEEQIKENIENRIKRFEISEKELDREWTILEETSKKEQEVFISNSMKALLNVDRTPNHTQVLEKVKQYESEMNARIFKVVGDINKLRDEYFKQNHFY